MGKKKSSRRDAAAAAVPKPPEQAATDPAQTTAGSFSGPDFADGRAGLGRGSLAEQVLDSLELAMGELQRAHREVAALGKSLSLAREQLAEQEDELELLRDAAAP